MERCVLDAQPPESKYSTHVTLMPLYHWTESKISVHMFVCVAALTYLALLCHHLAAAGLSISAKEAINEMRALRTAIFLAGPDGKLKRALETVTDIQQAILKAMGHQVEDGKVAPL
jgi:transposase